MTGNTLYTVYGTSYSGNCYKLKLLLTQLNLLFEWHEIDILKGESRTPEFLAKNPNGKVPLLEISQDQYIPESNAALFYLAENTDLLPIDKFEKAQVLQWMFFEQYSHEPFIATSRFIIKYLDKAEEMADILAQKKEPGYKALAVMDNHLKDHSFFVGNRYTIADIALYAYTHVAEDGAFNLTPYTNVREWLQRVESQPDFIPMMG